MLLVEATSHMTHHLTESQVSLPLSGLCNPEPAEASWRGGRQRRPSVVCVFSLVPCHKTLPPEHPRVPMCTVLRLGTRAHWSTFIARWLQWGERLYSAKGPDTIAPVFERVSFFFFFFVAAGSLHKHAINLNWSSSVEHRKTFSALRQRRCSPELHKIETDLRLS